MVLDSYKCGLAEWTIDSEPIVKFSGNARDKMNDYHK